MDALIFATPPPPVGGIASLVETLHQAFADRNDIAFVAPIARNPEFAAVLVRPLRNLIRLTQAVSRVKKGGRVLLFSSAGRSFYEKLIWSLLIVSRARRSVIVMVDGGFPHFWAQSSSLFHRIASRIVCRPLSELAAQSENWRNYYRSILPSASIKVVGPPIAVEFFEHPRNPPPSQSTDLLYVGWIIPEKGILDLLDALLILSKTHPTVSLRLIGPMFGKESYWNKVAAERGLATRVTFVGPLLDRNRLVLELDNASVFVFPSHFEGLPVALLEAMTRGLACIGTTVGAIPDMLDHGQAGILVAPQTPTELAEALKSMLNDPALREMFSKRARDRARKIYNHSEFVASYKFLLALK